MDKNQLIGFGLIFLLLIGWSYLNRPSEAELKEMQVRKDSIEALKNIDTTKQIVEQPVPIAQDTTLPDTVKNTLLAKDFGAFSAAASGNEEEVVLENDVIKLTFTNKGGRIKEAWLKEYKKFEKQPDYTFKKVDLKLLDDEDDKFEYVIPVANTTKGTVKTSDLYFDAKVEGNTVTFQASAGNGRYIEQKYTLTAADDYLLDYNLSLVGLDKVIPDNAKTIQFNWENNLAKLEKNAQYERSQYSGVHYRIPEKNQKCIGNKKKELDKEVQWISSAQQFFNTTIIAKNNFASGTVEAEALEEDDENLKRITAELQVPFNHNANEAFPMQLYVGPNDFSRLKEFDNEMEDIIEFGWGIFGTINRWMIRPMFNFLSQYIGNMGIVILILTLIIKIFLYPLYYRMLYSQAKMGALKPQLEKIKEKTGDDQQAYSAEQMKLYRETGVNPLGGCFPMVLQMPIWFALYRFFPASIDFRQQGFLWADDLSSYDSIWTWGELPILDLIQFDHLSLFTLLWAGTTVIYTYYNSKHVTMPNPAMKYVQYFMPIMFIFFFNSFASGLTCYLLFSNLFNIAQTLVTKEWIIDKKKIEKLLEENRKKPKKTTGFQARLEEAMKQQQNQQKQRANEKTKETLQKRNTRRSNKGGNKKK